MATADRSEDFFLPFARQIQIRLFEAKKAEKLNFIRVPTFFFIKKAMELGACKLLVQGRDIKTMLFRWKTGFT
jgi:hypothetical protein